MAGPTAQVRQDGDPTWQRCGLGREHREPDAVLRMRTVLWLGSLTGLRSEDFDGWAAFIAAAHGRVRELRDTGDDDGPWNGVAVFLDQAAGFAAEGNLQTAASACEVAAVRLRSAAGDGRIPGVTGR